MVKTTSIGNASKVETWPWWTGVRMIPNKALLHTNCRKYGHIGRHS